MKGHVTRSMYILTESKGLTARPAPNSYLIYHRYSAFAVRFLSIIAVGSRAASGVAGRGTRAPGQPQTQATALRVRAALCVVYSFDSQFTHVVRNRSEIDVLAARYGLDTNYYTILHGHPSRLRVGKSRPM